MPNSRADRDLLFGILALQNNFISREQLLTAFNAWVVDKSRPIAAILQDQKALAENVRTLLEALAEQHIAQHGGDAEKSLAAVSSGTSARQVLEQVGDADVQASLGLVACAADPFATVSHAVGEATSAGARFRILRPHAKGGLGEVYVAEDQELHREVALKQMQDRHAHDEGSRSRFILEAEITGRLEHPGIVPVYGLGAYADGRPFYAMRFVRGDSLKEAIARFHRKRTTDSTDDTDKNHNRASSSSVTSVLSVVDFSSVAFRKLLGRFLDVCNAIQYAHDRGVLHRDLKPGNIMLGPYGETLVVDWGLAKAVGTSEPDAPARDSCEPPLIPQSGSGVAETVAGSAIGTPQYMSPEQAGGRLDLLGPASDVYSLGATLYSLLTGKPPIEKDDVGTVLRKVEHGEFPKPREHNAAIPRPLEAVCLRAMATKIEDRYASPRHLADDVERWLADEPVTAWLEPWTVKARRWTARHRTLVSTGVTVLFVSALALAAGFAITAGLNQELERRRVALQASLDREQDERKRAEENERLAKSEEQRANERAGETKAVLDFVENKIFAAARPQDLGPKVTMREAVEAALPFVEKSFTKQPLIEARLRLTLGTSFSHLGDPKIALEQYEASRALYTKHRGRDHPDTLASVNNLTMSYDALGRYAEALKLREETLALRKAKLGHDHPDILRSMHNLATSHALLGRHAEALKLEEETLRLRKAKLGHDHPDTLSSMNSLANSYEALGRHAEALKLYEDTLAIRKAKLGPNHLDTLRSLNNLGVSYIALGRHAEALKLYEDTLAIQKAKLGFDHPDTLSSMSNLASSYYALGRHAEALKLREETLSLQKTKLGHDHPKTLRSMNNLANSYEALGRHAEAFKLREETLTVRKAKLGADHPDTLSSMWALAISLVRLDRGQEAVAVIDECLKRAPGKVVNPQTLRQVGYLRLHHFQKRQDASGCRTTAELWEKLKRTDATSLYNAACFRAVTAGVIKSNAKTPAADADRLAKEEADRAMAWLQKAVAAGYSDVAHMRKDADLDALRDRDDFKKLVAELEAKKK